MPPATLHRMHAGLDKLAVAIDVHDAVPLHFWAAGKPMFHSGGDKIAARCQG